MTDNEVYIWLVSQEEDILHLINKALGGKPPQHKGTLRRAIAHFVEALVKEHHDLNPEEGMMTMEDPRVREFVDNLVKAVSGGTKNTLH